MYSRANLHTCIIAYLCRFVSEYTYNKSWHYCSRLQMCGQENYTRFRNGGLCGIRGRARAEPQPDGWGTAMTSSGHVTSPFDSARPLSYRLQIVNNPLSPVQFPRYLASKTETDVHARNTYTKTPWHRDMYKMPARYTLQPSGGEFGEQLLHFIRLVTPLT